MDKKTILIDTRITAAFHPVIIDYVKTMILKDGTYKIGYNYYNILIDDNYNILVSINIYKPDTMIIYKPYEV